MKKLNWAEWFLVAAFIGFNVVIYFNWADVVESTLAFISILVIYIYWLVSLIVIFINRFFD